MQLDYKAKIVGRQAENLSVPAKTLGEENL